MVLRGLLYQLTGDEEVAATGIAVDPTGFQTAMKVARDEDVALLRRKATEFLDAYRASGAEPLDIGPEERLPLSLSLTLGEEIDDEEFEFCLEELALDPWAAEPALAGARPPQRLEDFSVTVIGAGAGRAERRAHAQAAGIPYTVIEKNAGVGGTWCENRYPGARVDTPSRAYTHLFGADFPYSSPFCDWAENQRYFDWVADTFELRDDIDFETEVRALTWDEAVGEWRDRHRGARRAKPAALERGDHGRRLPQPAEDPRDRGHGGLPGRLVAHGALAAGRRPQGQARRGHRHRLHRLPDDPGARAGGRARRRVPADAAVAASACPATGRRSRRR